MKESKSDPRMADASAAPPKLDGRILHREGAICQAFWASCQKPLPYR
jgi:hypothetical protein